MAIVVAGELAEGLFFSTPGGDLPGQLLHESSGRVGGSLFYYNNKIVMQDIVFQEGT